MSSQAGVSHHQASPRPRRGRGGYTLLEVVVVAAILSLLVTLAIATWSAMIREGRVSRAAEDIAGMLRLAREAAVANTVDACRYRVIVSSTLARAEVRSVARNDATGTCASPEVVTTVRVTDQFPAGVADTTVEFLSAGRLSGSIPMSIAVTSGDRVRYVRVEPATGRVEVGPTP